MLPFRLESSGWLDRRDSAFPQAVQLPNGEILCSFSVGGGPNVHGGTDWARSSDGGRSWTVEGTILPATEDPPTANFLKLSLAPDGATIHAYGTRFWGNPDAQFGRRRGETLFCVSTDDGHRWSEPRTIPMPDLPLEVSHAMLPLSSGRLLAPAALLSDPDRLGEEVFVAVSNDGGQSWPARRTVLRDPAGRLGFWEQKLAEISPGVVIVVAWTVSLGDYRDQKNSFTLSHDGGWTWGPRQSTGIRGQTLSVLPLGEDRLLALYNRRYGRQGIVMALVSWTETSWHVEWEGMLHDAGEFREGPADGQSGVDELSSFQFGFPTAIRLTDGAVLATHWCVEQGVCGVRWTRIEA
jgi:hypothetical protein